MFEFASGQLARREPEREANYWLSAPTHKDPERPFSINNFRSPVVAPRGTFRWPLLASGWGQLRRRL